SAGRREATGRGIVFVLYQAAKSLGQELRGKKIVVQGFGNVGSVAARLLWNDGCTIAGISDVKGGVWNPTGIDIRQLQDHVAQTGSVAGFPGGEPVSNEAILEQPCDVLIPAAVDSVIHARNADRIKARIIAEGANGPTTPEADLILRDRGVTVIPDILCNAGGVVVSYFEWVQGLQYYFWKESEIIARLQEIMARSFSSVWRTAQKSGVDLRTGALMEGISRVADALIPLWEAAERATGGAGAPPPYWAFAWPGGQAIARAVLDAPQWVAGQRVLDFASGSGVAGIAAAQAGAAHVVANDIDAYSLAAIALNAALNGVHVELSGEDLVGQALSDIDVVLAGDVCYEAPMSARVLPWLRALAAAGKTVLLADPGRAYAPKDGLDEIARYSVPTSLELEDREVRETVVWQLRS
ncbi:MAG: 50S ribosomal protein L11 methyltransferase, partial [Terriglobales bacterium]